MEKKYRFIIIEDDEKVVKTLEQLILKLFPLSEIDIAEDGLFGFDLIKKFPSNSIVFASLNLQQLGGLKLLQNIRADEKFSDIYYILITEQQYKEERIKSMQSGCDDLIIKPLSLENLVRVLRSATNYVNLKFKMQDYRDEIADLQKELLQDAEKMKELIIQFMRSKLADYDKKVEFILKAAKWVAKAMGEDNPKFYKDLTDATQLAWCGKLFLPEQQIESPVMKKGYVTNQKMEKVPAYASELVSKIRSYENVAKILNHIYENFDGTGIPGKLKSWEIPFGSRILRVMLDYEEFYRQSNKNEFKAMELLEAGMPRLYEFKIVGYLDQFFASQVDLPVSKRTEEAIRPTEMESGLKLSRNILTNSGLVLLSKGTRIDEEKIDKILEASRSDGILGQIFIEKDREN